MPGKSHLEEHLERDLDVLKARLSKMANLVLRQLDDAIAAFTDDNRKLAYAVVLRDHRIDMLEDHIDRLCQEFLVRHMPVASQLRFIVAAVKVNSELERIGDYAEGIARRVVAVAEADAYVPQRQSILEMANVASQMLRHSIDAFLNRDTSMAARTLESDRKVDAMNSQMFESLSDSSSELPLTVRFALLGLTSRIERVADRACNIAEEAIYVARGQVVRHIPREDIRVLFLCENNECRSQMAEGIARRLAPAHFIFSSAGAAPGVLDENAVKYMAGQGIDISRQRPKAISAVGDINDFNILVTLSQAAEEETPEVPYHSVVLNWEIPDPHRAVAQGQDVKDAYAETYEKLLQKIRDMTDGLVGAYEMEEET